MNVTSAGELSPTSPGSPAPQSAAKAQLNEDSEMAQTTLIIDEDTAKALEELKQSFGAKTNAAVIRRALALARIAARNADDDDTLTILDREKHEKKIMLKA